MHSSGLLKSPAMYTAPSKGNLHVVHKCFAVHTAALWVHPAAFKDVHGGEEFRNFRKFQWSGRLAQRNVKTYMENTNHVGMMFRDSPRRHHAYACPLQACNLHSRLLWDREQNSSGGPPLALFCAIPLFCSRWSQSSLGCLLWECTCHGQSPSRALRGPAHQTRWLSTD